MEGRVLFSIASLSCEVNCSVVLIKSGSFDNAVGAGNAGPRRGQSAVLWVFAEMANEHNNHGDHNERMLKDERTNMVLFKLFWTYLHHNNSKMEACCICSLVVPKCQRRHGQGSPPILGLRNVAVPRALDLGACIPSTIVDEIQFIRVI